MAPVEHASDELRSIEDEGKSSMSPCLPLIVFQHQSCQHKNEHEMLMFSVSQKHLLLHAAADIAPDLVTGNMFWTSPQGWMLVIKSTRSPSSSSAAWLWNPRTGDRITLPDVERDGDHDIDIPLDCKCLLTHRRALRSHGAQHVVLQGRRRRPPQLVEALHLRHRRLRVRGTRQGPSQPHQKSHLEHRRGSGRALLHQFTSGHVRHQLHLRFRRPRIPVLSLLESNGFPRVIFFP